MGTQECLNCSSQLLLKERYQATRQIGEGNFSRSFLAEDTRQANTNCVIKQFSLQPQIQGNSEAMAKTIQLFEQEAKLLVEVGEQCPEIPAVLDYFVEDKRLYLIQPYIEGQNLWQELQAQGEFNEHQLREFLYDLLPVLQLLHKRQIIHRQIKPTNIIRKSSDRKFMLMNLGISKQLSETKLLKIGSRTTEPYLAIEQVRTGKAYPASDLYSLGVVCIQMLTQAQIEELYDPLEGRWVWREYLRNIGKDVSDELSQVLDKMLKDAVNDRYQSATELLKDFYDSASKRVTRISAAGKTQAQLQQAKQTQQTQQTQQPQQPQQPQQTQQPQQKIVGWRCVHTLNRHTDTVTCVVFGRYRNLLASGSADSSINVWHYPSGKLVHKLTDHSDTVTAMAFSPDGKVLATGSADKTIKIWQIDSGKLIYSFTGHSVTVFSVAFSPDGQLLASGSGDGTIKLWQLGTGKLVEVLTGHSDFVESVAFSRDGQFLASGSWDNTIKIWQVATGKLLYTLTGHSGSVWSIAVSPDSQTIASNSGDNTIKIWHLASGLLVRTLTVNSGSTWSIAYSPDGQTIASDSNDNTIKIWHVASGQLVRTLSGHSGQVRCVAFGYQGKTIASASDDMTVKVWRCD
ncbi:MAG TPA: serine/threonine-protein kinase [Leptolyngbyaceae cyanobacterium]